jgi:hypothetical protein
MLIPDGPLHERVTRVISLDARNTMMIALLRIIGWWLSPLTQYCHERQYLQRYTARNPYVCVVVSHLLHYPRPPY